MSWAARLYCVCVRLALKPRFVGSGGAGSAGVGPVAVWPRVKLVAIWRLRDWTSGEAVGRLARAIDRKRRRIRRALQRYRRKRQACARPTAESFRRPPHAFRRIPNVAPVLPTIIARRFHRPVPSRRVHCVFAYEDDRGTGTRVCVR